MDSSAGASALHDGALRDDAHHADARHADARKLLKRYFGYDQFRGEQANIIDHIARGGDCLVLMPTGGGKSLCYQIPSLLRSGTGVVISPLIALMQDQVSALEAVGIRAAYLNSTLSAREANDVEQQLLNGQLDLLYIAPERLMTERCLDLLGRAQVALFAIDEAHCVSQWGHDFRPEYAQLSILKNRFAGIPRIALTATADTLTRGEIIEKIGLDDAPVFLSSFDRPNIKYTIVEKDDPRKQLLRFLKNEHDGDAGIVYCLSRSKVEETAAWLSTQGISALPYHAGLPATERSSNQSRFLRDDGIVMVATIAFGMGIDKPDVRFVAHLDLPKSIEGYYQETGRAGRDGGPANAWMTYGLQDVVQQRRMIELSEADDNYKRVCTGKLDFLLGLCETAQCRRQRLLQYFSEHREPGWQCGNCDNCISPPKTFDGTELVQKLLSAIYRTGQRFGALHVIDVLLGKINDKTTKFNHDKLSVFGIGKDLDDKQWRNIIRQCIAMNMVQVHASAYNTLSLTEFAKPVLKGVERIALRQGLLESKEPVSRTKSGASKTRKTGKAGDTNYASDDPVFDKLRAWRAKRAKDDNVPAYVVMHDATLRAIAQAMPDCIDDMYGISGLGEKRIERFGEEILELLEELN